jgi:hypothetical protein
MVLNMKNQLRGLALILIGIQLTIVAMIDPWILILGGDVGRTLIPVISMISSITGLFLCFKREKDR